MKIVYETTLDTGRICISWLGGTAHAYGARSEVFDISCAVMILYSQYSSLTQSHIGDLVKTMISALSLPGAPAALDKHVVVYVLISSSRDLLHGGLSPSYQRKLQQLDVYSNLLLQARLTRCPQSCGRRWPT